MTPILKKKTPYIEEKNTVNRKLPKFFLTFFIENIAKKEKKCYNSTGF